MTAKLLHKKFAHTYGSWKAMKQRCFNERCKCYGGYGGRGITVCERWRWSFETFLGDMGPKPSPKHELDRINNDGNYEPGNCRWATRTQQTRNTRVNRILEFRGERRCLTEWAELFGVPSSRVERRLGLGHSIERALTNPVLSERRLCIRGHERDLAATGVSKCRACESIRGANKRARKLERETATVTP